MKIYLDGPDPNVCQYIGIDGFTTNPSLMKKYGVTDYKKFSADILLACGGKPVSFEVMADDFPTMESQAREIATWGENVYVKIPVTNTKGESCAALMHKLGLEGIKVNATAILTMSQIEIVGRSLVGPSILSIFCGRIADTGRDPVPFITKALHVKHSETEILWASTREVLNVKQAEACGADIITMTPDLIKKMSLFGKDLGQYSLETVQQFFTDSKGLSL